MTGTFAADIDNLAWAIGVLATGGDVSLSDCAANFDGVTFTADAVVVFAVTSLFVTDDFVGAEEIFTVGVGAFIDGVGPFIGVETIFDGEIVTLAAVICDFDGVTVILAGAIETFPVDVVTFVDGDDDDDDAVVKVVDLVDVAKVLVTIST